MPIKVIGFDPAASRKVTCHACGAILEFYTVDIQTKRSYDYDGAFDLVKFIKCPNCDKEVFLK